jgi:hypothetical protein
VAGQLIRPDLILAKLHTSFPSPLVPSTNSPPLPSFTPQQEDINTCIEEYANITVWSTTHDASTGQPIVHFPEEDIMTN